MIEQAEKFLQSSPGHFSSARLMFVVGLLWSMVMTTVGLLILRWEVGAACAFFGSTSGTFIALKLGQKTMEGKTKTEETT
jgi:hypothetical protein